MWIFISIFLVLMSLIICSRFYNIMFPGIRFISTELVLIPLRFLKSNLLFSFSWSVSESKFLTSLKDSGGTQ